MERADAAAIEALLQVEPDVLDLNRAAEAQLDAERVDAAAIEALLQAEPGGALVHAKHPHAPRE